MRTGRRLQSPIAEGVYMRARNTAMFENIEFTNSPPTVDQVPRFELELFCRIIVDAVRKEKLQKEEKEMAKKIEEIRAKSLLNSTVKSIEKQLAGLSEEEREEVVSNLWAECQKSKTEG